jgi:hypothetical protein
VPRRRWRSAEAQQLIRLTGAQDPRGAIAQLADTLLREAEVVAPPVDLRLVGSFQGVRDIVAVPMKQAGRLVPTGDGYVVYVNAGDSSGRQNFTAAHEIGHTLIPGYQAHPSIVDDLTTGSFRSENEVEYLCDVAAAELLLPMRLFRPLAAGLGFGLDTVEELSRVFGASRLATALRLAEADLWPGAAAVWYHGHKPTERRLLRDLGLTGDEAEAPAKKLRVRCSVSSPNFRHDLHPHLSAPADGPLARCFERGGSIAAMERLIVRGQVAQIYVLAAAVDYAVGGEASREVLSLLLSVDGDWRVWPGAPVTWPSQEA